MKQSSKDPFEVAFEEDEDENNEEEENNTSANNNQPVKLELDEDYDEEEEEEENEEEDKDKSIESPIRGDNEFDDETPTKATTSTTNRRPGKEVVTVDADGDELRRTGNVNVASSTQNQSNKKRKIVKSNKEDEDEEDDENMDVDLAKFTPTGDPAKMAKMQEILSQLTDEQMSRYESFRRSGFQKANMKKLLASIIGTPKISVPMTIVVSGIAKMFVGELVETGRMVMTERGETGPIRPCHIREAYRRLKLEGKVPKKSVPRLFR